MRLANLLIVNALVLFAFGVLMLFAPTGLMSLYEVTLGPTAVYVARLFAAAVIGFGILNWAARNVTDPAAVRAITLGNLSANGVGLVVTLLAQTEGIVGNLGWSTVLLFTFFTLGFGFFYLTRAEGT